jgi:hypothetical protein
MAQDMKREVDPTSDPKRLRQLSETMRTIDPTHMLTTGMSAILRSCADRIESHERPNIRARIERMAEDLGVTIDWNWSLRDFVIALQEAMAKRETVRP